MPNSDSWKTAADRVALMCLLQEINAQRVSADDQYAMWANSNGVLYLGVVGYETLTRAAALIAAVDAWKTYPEEFLIRVVAYAVIDFRDDVAHAAENIIERLNAELGEQRAFVGFWNISLEDGLELDFGRFRLQRLGDEGYERELLKPFRAFRSGNADLQRDIERIEKYTNFLREIPVLIVNYEGAAAGAKEIVNPIAERVSEFLQFSLALSWRSRDEIKTIDHRGRYRGRFMTVMPVLTLSPPGLCLPNIRESPYGETLSRDTIQNLRAMGALDLLPFVPDGPSKGDSLNALLLRSIQLFADGERATSDRQAAVSYIGACEALLGHRKQPEIYTCTGIALCLEQDFAAGYREAKDLYDKRSRAAHQGISPEGIDRARTVAHKTIEYVLKHRAQRSTKKAIRQWIEASLTSKPEK